MLESIRLITVLDATGAKIALVSLLKEHIFQMVHVDTMVDALAQIKRQHFNCAILSTDIEDYYSLENMIKILTDIGSIEQIILVSEKEDSSSDFSAISLTNQEQAHNQLLQLLEQLDLAARHKNTPKKVVKTPSSIRQSLFDSVPSGLYRIQVSGDFVDCNQTLMDICKAPTKETLCAGNYFSLFPEAEEANNWRDLIEHNQTIHELVHTLKRYDGQTIWVRDTVRAVYNEDNEICYYDGSIEDISVQKRLEDKLTFLATQDILTGLPNRNFFHDQAKLTVSQARYSEDFVAFLVVDIDHFSHLNETYGFKAGDKILQTVATRLKGQLRKSDVVARLGDDKFIILLSGIRFRKDVLAVAKKIRATFSTLFTLPNGYVEVSASLGISLFPEHGDDINTLIKLAEMASYGVKEQSRGGYRIYEGPYNIS